MMASAWFVTLFTIAFGSEAPTVGSVTLLFIQEAIGGIVYGFLLGLVFHYLISATDDHSMELLHHRCSYSRLRIC